MSRKASRYLRQSVVASIELEFRDDREEMIEQKQLHVCERNQFNGLCWLRAAHDGMVL